MHQYVYQCIKKFISDSEGIRTPNQQNRNLPFYPIELRSQSLAKIIIIAE